MKLVQGYYSYLPRAGRGLQRNSLDPFSYGANSCYRAGKPECPHSVRTSAQLDVSKPVEQIPALPAQAMMSRYVSTVGVSLNHGELKMVVTKVFGNRN
jgi:hypothetical protein